MWTCSSGLDRNGINQILHFAPPLDDQFNPWDAPLDYLITCQGHGKSGKEESNYKLKCYCIIITLEDIFSTSLLESISLLDYKNCSMHRVASGRAKSLRYAGQLVKHQASTWWHPNGGFTLLLWSHCMISCGLPRIILTKHYYRCPVAIIHSARIHVPRDIGLVHPFSAFAGWYQKYGVTLHFKDMEAKLKNPLEL